MTPSRMTATIRESSLSASGILIGLSVFARVTLTPFWSIGVITMKMINNTSITSTIGVTLMSELTPATFFFFPFAIVPYLRGIKLPADVAALQEVINQFAGAVFHFDVEGFNATGEVVEHPDGRDGHEQTDGGG